MADYGYIKAPSLAGTCLGKNCKPLQVRLVIQSRRQGQEESRICVDHVNRRLFHDVYPLELLDQSTS